MLFLPRGCFFAKALYTSSPFLNLVHHISNIGHSSQQQQQQQQQPHTLDHIKEKVKQQYIGGRYCYLVREVIALPEVLLAAYDRVWKSGNLHEWEWGKEDQIPPTKWFQETAFELLQGTLDVESSSRTLFCTKDNQMSLVIPDLRLRVVQMAIKMVLDVIYNGKLSLTSPSYHVGKGERHTALKYVADVFQDSSWFISLPLCKRFGSLNMKILIGLLEEDIQDTLLFGLIWRMFEVGVLCLDIGFFPKGQGFPQEGILTSTLINFYLSHLDREIERIDQVIKEGGLGHLSTIEERELDRLSTVKDGGLGCSCVIKNGGLGIQSLIKEGGLGHSNAMKDGGSGHLSAMKEGALEHNSSRVNACRYVDELLISVTGPEELARSVKDRVTEFLRLELCIGICPSELWNATQDKVEFLGMDIRVDLRFQPVSSKSKLKLDCIVAKNSRHQVATLALQKRMHWEAGLDRMGKRLLVHALRKARAFTVGDEQEDHFVKKILMEVAREGWNRDRDSECKTPLGLLHPLITEHLPKELADSYFTFQQKAEEYLLTLANNKTPIESRGVARLEKKSITNSRRRVLILAPVERLEGILRARGLINEEGRPRPMLPLISQDDKHIIQWFSCLANQWLQYFRCCDNFTKVKGIVSFHVRSSCISTLAHKHKASKRDIVEKYTRDLVITSDNPSDSSVCSFPLEKDVRDLRRRFLVDPVNSAECFIQVLYLRKSRDMTCRKKCLVSACENRGTNLYVVRTPKTEENPQIEMAKLIAPHPAFGGKWLHLCDKHLTDLNSGNISLQTICF